MIYIPKVGEMVIIKRNPDSKHFNSDGKMDKWINTIQKVEEVDKDGKIYFVGGGSHEKELNREVLNSWSWKAENNCIFPVNKRIIKLKFNSVCNETK